MAATNDLLMRILAQDKATPVLKNAQRSVTGFGQAVSSVTGILGTFGVALGGAAIVGGLVNLTRLGAQAETVGQSFDNLARSTGLASDAMLGSLRQASRGAISDMELMQAANKAMIMGGQEMGRALPQLLELARAAALATGEDMQFMFNSIVTGIARQSPLILDNLGLIVDMPGAYKRYADSVGVAVTSLTEQQKMTALLNDVLRITPDYINKVGANGVSATENIQSFTTAITNLKTQLGLLINQSGAPEQIGNVGGFVAANLQRNDLARQVQEYVAELRRMGQSGLADSIEAQFKDIALASAFTTAEVKKQIAAYERLSERAAAATNVTNDFTSWMVTFRTLANESARGTELWAAAIDFLSGKLRSAIPAAKEMSAVMAGASYGNKLPEYIASTAKIGERYYNYHHGESAGETYGDGFVSGFDSVLFGAQSKAQSALTSRMSPTGLDFLLTGMGQYQNAPLENVRRLDAIIARGFSEIKAHADWASVLKIPQEVLTGSETALKAWATQTRDAAANLARPDLIDWDAFLREFDRITAEEIGRQTTLDIAMGKLAGTGRLGNQEQSKRILQSMLGLDTPETQALALGEALNRAFSASDPAGIYLNAFKVGTDQNKNKIDEISKRLGAITPDGKQAAEKYVADFNATVAALVGGGIPATVGGGYVLP